MLNVTIAKEGKGFIAVCKDAPGSPLCGRGSTMEIALGKWLRNNQGRIGVNLQVDPSAWPAEKRRRRRELKSR